jgi:hypothetical protein
MPRPPRAGRLVEVPHPEQELAANWLSANGIKGEWSFHLGLAEFYELAIDDIHKDLHFLINKLIGSERKEDIVGYLFQNHGILPSAPMDLSRLRDVLQTDARPQGNASEPRLVVDLQPPKAVFDGEPYKLSNDQAVYLHMLLEAKGDWVSGPEIQKAHPAFDGARVTRIRKGLDKTLQALIEASNRGSRILKEKLA